MAKVLVTYYSSTGNTRAMAEAIVEGAVAGKAEVDLLGVGAVNVPCLLDYDALVVGSPTYYGLPAHQIVKFFDDSVTLHGRLAGRVGAAFATSANIGGGNESTCLAILQMMLVHGMLAVGAAQGDHYGPVAIGTPDQRALSQCRAHGQRVAELAAKLAAR